MPTKCNHHSGQVAEIKYRNVYFADSDRWKIPVFTVLGLLIIAAIITAIIFALYNLNVCKKS